MSNLKSFYINGQWVAPATPNDFDVINPSNEEVCATISLGSEADTNAAVAAAKAAFPAWAAVPKSDKLDFLHAVLKEYNNRADDLAEAMSLEMGAPIDLSKTS
ncbi:MAG TPA: aldehyde dehydrogenase family protein, partial [Rhodobacteraceae bacterium]|nr:aldehyde dehydrogenase family protein [Paracoccaceae bacterium]